MSCPVISVSGHRSLPNLHPSDVTSSTLHQAPPPSCGVTFRAYFFKKIFQFTNIQNIKTWHKLLIILLEVIYLHRTHLYQVKGRKEREGGYKKERKRWTWTERKGRLGLEKAFVSLNLFSKSSQRVGAEGVCVCVKNAFNFNFILVGRTHVFNSTNTIDRF